MNSSKSLKTEMKIKYCRGCLSSDRLMLTPNIEFMDIFMKICGLSFEPYNCDTKLCWECYEFIKKAWRFRKKTEIVQVTLQCHDLGQKDLELTTLSNLTISKLDSNNDISIVYQEDVKAVIPNEEPSQIMKEIKKEVDYQYDDNNLYDNYVNFQEENDAEDSDYKESNIKQENDQEILPKRKYKYKRGSWRSRYLQYYKILKTKKYNYMNVLKSSIKYCNMETYLEKEKENEIYTTSVAKCEKCVLGFEDKDYYNMHIRKYHHKNAGDLICDYCKSRFKLKSVLEFHIKQHSYKRTCRLCPFSSFTRQNMARHLETHSKKVQCLICQEKFGSTPEFHKHYNTIHRTPHCCEVCGKVMKSQLMLGKHMKKHTGHPCSMCGKRFKSSYSLNKHMESQHDCKSKETAYCVQCNKGFTSNAGYKVHLLTTSAHAAERKPSSRRTEYPCTECDKVYTRRSYMMNHFIYIHKGGQKYHCEHCQRSFLNRTSYKNHMMYTHEKRERPKQHLCTVCGRGFTTKRILIHHMRTHTGERPHECPHCAAKFAQDYALKTHVRHVHLKERRHYADKARRKPFDLAPDLAPLQ